MTSARQAQHVYRDDEVGDGSGSAKNEKTKATSGGIGELRSGGQRRALLRSEKVKGLLIKVR